MIDNQLCPLNDSELDDTESRSFVSVERAAATTLLEEGVRKTAERIGLSSWRAKRDFEAARRRMPAGWGSMCAW